MSYFQRFCLCLFGKLNSLTNGNKYRPPKMKYLKEILPQQFPFPNPLMHYVIKNATPEHIKKLQQTCRYFYSKFNYNIIDHLRIDHSDTVKITNYYVAISEKKIKFLRNNLCLTESLYIASRYKNLEKMFQKIIKCDIEELYIASCCNYFKLSDFAILTKSKNLKTVEIYTYIYYSDDDNTRVSIEDIISYIPNVTIFHIMKCIYTSNTMQKLSTLKRNVKFSWLTLVGISEQLNSHLFNDYIKKALDFNTDPTSMMELTGDHKKLQEIHDIVKTWRPRSYFVEYNFLFIF